MQAATLYTTDVCSAQC